MSKHSTSDLTPSANATPGGDGAGTVAARTAAVPKPRLDESQVLGCESLHYPWDDWERWAKAQGVPDDLAGLGRLTVREAYQHQWDDRLKSLCGWRDDGQRMLRLALRSPGTARNRWQRLLDTDGYRGEYDEQTGEWISWR